jgi:hypothetical protein
MNGSRGTIVSFRYLLMFSPFHTDIVFSLRSSVFSERRGRRPFAPFAKQKQVIKKKNRDIAAPRSIWENMLCSGQGEGYAWTRNKSLTSWVR